MTAKYSKFRGSQAGTRRVRLVEGPRFISMVVTGTDGAHRKGAKQYVVALERSTGRIVRFKDGGKSMGIEQNRNGYPRVYRRSHLPG